MTENLTFDRRSGVTFKVDQEARTIKGLAVPFDVIGDNGFGKYRFKAGTLDWSKVKLLDGHDWSKAGGTVGLAEVDEGLDMSAKVARGARGDELLALADDGVYDGLSIGLSSDSKFVEADDGVLDCVQGTVLEVSLTPMPAFADAQVRSVAASAAQNKENNMTQENKETEGGVATFSKEDGAALMAQVQDLTAKFAELETIKRPVGPETARFDITEEPIYRFSGTERAPSGFDFAEDLHAVVARGDGKSLERIAKFSADRLGQRFADQPTTTGDTAALNPNKYRPDMFLGQAPVPQSPLYDTFHKGIVSDVTPFYWSKLDRSNTDIGVADHTEGTDPEDRDLVTATVATVTPVPVSGKVHLTREVGDQGGTPQVSGLIWSEFERSFSIALETKTAALLAAAAGSVTALCTIAAGASGVVAGRALESGLVGLQFLADGSRFTKAFGHVDLFKALAGATLPRFSGDTDGDLVYPIINPQNRNGITGSKYSFIELSGYRMEPAASLGATSTSASNSWVADPNAVHVWNSGLTRLDKLNETVEGWDLGCFGYFAGVVYDVTGLRKIAYDPTA